jgi:hypothetical protein
MDRRAWRSLLVVFVLFFAWAALPAQAQAVDGPVFLVIALDNADGTAGTFDVTDIKASGKDAGSNTIIVKVGTLSSGGEIGGANDTTFTSEPPADGVPVPKISGVYLDPTTLEGNESTVFGTFEVQPLEGGDLEPHMLTTSSESTTEIDPVIQAAVFAAASALEAAVAEDPFMKTGEIADIVFQELPNNSTLTRSDVAEALFGPDGPSDPQLLGPNSDPPTASGTVECDGELFPHEEGAALYEFKIALKATKDSKGNNSKFADYDLAKLIKNVEVVVKESSVNPDKNGTMPVAIYSGPGFDAADVDTDSVLLFVVGGTDTGVPPSSTSVSDQNGDGISDLVCHFSVPTLVSDAGLSSSTTKLKLTGALNDGVTEIRDLDISISMLQK